MALRRIVSGDPFARTACLARSSVLPSPPRTLSNLEISRFAANGPELAGSAVGPLVSAETVSGVEPDFGRVVSGPEIPFPGNETVSGGDTVRIGSALVRRSVQGFDRAGL